MLGPTEVNDLALILAAGMDKGKKNNIELSALIFIPQAPNKVDKDLGCRVEVSSSQSFVRSAEGKTVAEAMTRLQEALTREIFWGQNEVLLIGDELAKEGISDQIDFWMRHSKPRIRADVFVSKGKAKECFEGYAGIGTRRFKTTSQISQNTYWGTGNGEGFIANAIR